MDVDKKVIYKLVIIIVFLLLLVIFTLQNTQQVNVRLFFWSIPHISIALTILIPLAIGLLIGWLGIPLIVSRKRGNPKTREEKRSD